MAMTVIATNNVEDRYRGFLLSCMPEVGPGIYVSPRMSSAVRDRIWNVLAKWYESLQNGSILMAFSDSKSPSGLRVEALGIPQKDLVDFDGFLAVKIHDFK